MKENVKHRNILGPPGMNARQDSACIWPIEDPGSLSCRGTGRKGPGIVALVDITNGERHDSQGIFGARASGSLPMVAIRIAA